MIKIYTTGLLLTILCNVLFAQEVKILTEKNKVSLRGLSIVNDSICWASGSKGTVVRTIDGGKNFEWLTVKSYEDRDFRDIEAFNANTALIMAVAEPAIILKTTDGGKNWYKVFEDTTKGMFLDAMSFADDVTGMVIGDPIHTKPFIAMTLDKGDTWIDPVRSDTNRLPTLFSGEAFFASSGTNICIKRDENNKLTGGFVSGGKKSRFFTNIENFQLPIIEGKESTGANSIDNFSKKNYIVVGGDFMNDKDTSNNCALSNDFGRTWHKPQTPPHGYRSCVIYIDEKTLLTCGTSGVDISHDGGMNWQLISNESFHVAQKAKQGNAIFMAGANGRIAKVNL